MWELTETCPTRSWHQGLSSKELTHESIPPPRSQLKMPMTLGFHSACPHKSLQDLLPRDTQMRKSCAHGYRNLGLLDKRLSINSAGGKEHNVSHTHRTGNTVPCAMRPWQDIERLKTRPWQQTGKFLHQPCSCPQDRHLHWRQRAPCTIPQDQPSPSPPGREETEGTGRVE